MKKSLELNTLVALAGKLSAKELKELSGKIMDMMRAVPPEGDSKSLSCNKMVMEQSSNVKPDCAHCRAEARFGYIIKRGSQNGVQRYFCKSCGRYFFPTTGTAFERTRKDATVWTKFIELTLSGASIEKCAEECNIAHQTAFTWRHKILNAFRIHQSSTSMSGKIELDEMLIPISYKGNHVKGGFHGRTVEPDGSNNGLPRPSYERGTDNKSSSSKDKACVFCMVKDGNKGFYATVPGVGFMKPSMLDKTVGKHVKKENTLILADQYKVTANYLNDNNYEHMLLASNVSDNYKEHKAEIRGDKHLQHVNAMHMHIRKFLAKYYGVSTKYLENYISLYVWLKNVAACKQKKNTQKVSVSRMATSDCYISCKELEAFPAVPSCA